MAKSQRRKLPKIVNETSIRGDDLRRIVSAAVATARREQADWKYCLLEIHFLQSPSFYSNAWAYDDGRIEIKLGRGFNGDAWEVEEVAKLLDHELGHLRHGMYHSKKLPAAWWNQATPVWAEKLRLRLRVHKQPLGIEVKIRRLLDDLNYVDENVA